MCIFKHIKIKGICEFVFILLFNMIRECWKCGKKQIKEKYLFIYDFNAWFCDSCYEGMLKQNIKMYKKPDDLNIIKLRDLKLIQLKHYENI